MLCSFGQRGVSIHQVIEIYIYIFDTLNEIPLCSMQVRVMMFNATFSNISIISWRSVLLLAETEVPGENHRPVTSHWQTLLQNVA
jgi:hypothetical protein